MMDNVDYLIDSSVLESYKNGKNRAVKFIYSVIEGDIKIAISPYTLYKIWGASTFDRKSEIGYIGLLKFIHVIDLNKETAQFAGHMVRSLKNSEVFENLESVAEHAIVGSIAKQMDCTVLIDSEIVIYDPEIRYVRLDDVDLDQLQI